MTTLREYKCPCCGGQIAFEAKLQKLKCEYCDTEFDVETLRQYDEDLSQDAPDRMEWSTAPGAEWQEGENAGMRVYSCNSCGGEVIADATLAATVCPYCDNPIVMTGQLSGALKPDLVIPFKLDKKAAKDALSAYFRDKRLLPKVFREQNHIDEIKGMYVPFWLFDADARASIRYRATRLRAWSDSSYNYTETSHFSITRAGTVSFEHVPVDGSSKMADDLMESIEPYDFSAAVDFRTAYLAGYLADKYDVDAEQSIDRANERIKKSTEQAFADTVTGFTSVTTEASGVSLSNGTARYALLPVWLLNTTWNGRRYTFAMNGQTGKMVGDLPLDKKAYLKWLFGIAAVTAAALFALITFVI